MLQEHDGYEAWHLVLGLSLAGAAGVAVGFLVGFVMGVK